MFWKESEWGSRQRLARTMLMARKVAVTLYWRKGPASAFSPAYLIFTITP